MKKVIAVSALAMAGVFSAQALADENKTGFYVTGKAGASVVAQTDQRFRQDLGEDVYKYKGGDKNDTVFGAGLAVGYDFLSTLQCSCAHGSGILWPRSCGLPLYTGYMAFSDGEWWSGRHTRTGLSVNTLMVNTYYDFRNSSAFTPWVSVGLGYARVHHKATYTDTSWNESGEISDISELHYSGYDNNFAWSIGAGVRYDVTPDIALDLSYRYLDAGKSSLSYKDAEEDKYKSEVDVKSHDIMFGVTYNF